MADWSVVGAGPQQPLLARHAQRVYPRQRPQHTHGATHAEQVRAWQQRHQAAGLCRTCTAPRVMMRKDPSKLSQYCAVHLAKAAEYSAKHYGRVRQLPKTRGRKKAA